MLEGRARQVLLTAGAWLLTASWLAPSHAKATELERSFALRGDFEDAQDMVRRAIDDGTQSLSFFVRRPARSKLRGINPVARAVAVRVDNELISVAFDRGTTYTSPADGRPVSVRLPGGEAAQLSQTFGPHGIEQVFSAPRGELRRLLRLHDGWLDMSVVISSKHLRDGIRFNLQYASTDGSEQARLSLPSP